MKRTVLHGSDRRAESRAFSEWPTILPEVDLVVRQAGALDSIRV